MSKGDEAPEMELPTCEADGCERDGRWRVTPTDGLTEWLCTTHLDERTAGDGDA